VAGSTLQTASVEGVQYLATEDLASGRTLVRRVDDGTVTASIAKTNVIFSPDASHYLWVGNRESDNAWGAHVYRTSDNVRRASYTQTDVTVAGWGSNSRLWVFRGGGATVRLRVADFTGSALTLVREFSGVLNTYTNALSPDGTRLVNWAGNKAVVYNVPTGEVVGTIQADMSYSALLAAFFVGNDLALHEWTWDGGTVYTSRIRILDVTSEPFTQRRTFADARNVQPYDYGKVAVAPDLSFAVFAASDFPAANGIAPQYLRVRSGIDNTVLRSYVGQFGEPAPMQCMALSADQSTVIYGTPYARLLIAVDLPVVLSNLTVSPVSVVGGNSSTGTVTISQPAPSGGTAIDLVGESGLTLPASVTIPAGATTATFTIGTTGVDAQVERDIAATLSGYTKHASLMVVPPSSLGIMFNPASVLGGSSSTGTITLNGKAGPSGIVVSLSSSQPFVTVPATATVAAGQASATFTATTSDPGATASAEVTGTWGAVSGMGMLEVRGSTVEAIFDVAGIKGGNALVLKVTLAAPAPSAGRTLSLVGTSLLDPPTTVVVPAGKSSVEIGIRTRPTLTDAVQTLTLHGESGPVGEASATVQAPLLAVVQPMQTSVTGAITVPVLLLLDGPAPAGLIIDCSSNNTAATLPARITFVEGRQYYSLNVACKKVIAHKIVTLTIGGKSVQIKLRPAQ
jgi:hypothetical protein